MLKCEYCVGNLVCIIVKSILSSKLITILYVPSNYCHLIKHGHNAYGMEDCKIFLFNHVQGPRHT